MRLAPAFANVIAAAWPIPLEAPVTTAFVLEKSMVIFVGNVCSWMVETSWPAENLADQSSQASRPRQRDRGFARMCQDLLAQHVFYCPLVDKSAILSPRAAITGELSARKTPRPCRFEPYGATLAEQKDNEKRRIWPRNHCMECCGFPRINSGFHPKQSSVTLQPGRLSLESSTLL